MEIILIWILISCCTFLGISHSLRTLDHNPIEGWDFFGWLFVLFFSVLFPLGLFILFLVHENKVRYFLFKERCFPKRNYSKCKPDECPYEF